MRHFLPKLALAHCSSVGLPERDKPKFSLFHHLPSCKNLIFFTNFEVRLISFLSLKCLTAAWLPVKRIRCDSSATGACPPIRLWKACADPEIACEILAFDITTNVAGRAFRHFKMKISSSSGAAALRDELTYAGSNHSLCL